MRKSQSIIILAILCLLFSVISSWAEPVNYSNWTKNLSGVTDTATGYYNYENAKMAVSGQYVHVVWLASGYGDISGNTLFYRGSSDGGQTFGNVQALVPNVSGNIFSATNVMLAADGDYVHIVYKAPGTPGGECLKYIRSTDNGQNFEAHRIIWSTDRYPGINGVYLTASNGRVAIGLSANDDNGAWPRYLSCVYSSDNGAAFTTNTFQSVNGTIWRYTVVDTIMSGSNVYILYIVTDINDASSQSHLYLASSNNGGAAFNTPIKVNLPTANGSFYATNVNGGNAANYSPHLAAVGNNVYVAFVNYYDDNTYTLRVRKSADGGKTLGDSVILGDPGIWSAFPAGPQAIAASGNYVYVASMNNGNTMFWRSADSGDSFGTPIKISDGGRTPLIGIDPSAADGSKIYVANGYLAKSTDWGASFNGIINPKAGTLIYDWMYPTLVVDSSGVVHYVGQTAFQGAPYDIFYRRLGAAATPGVAPKALNLITDSSNRKDNMQVAASPDINLTSAMTIEFWVRMDFLGDTYANGPHFQVSVAKKRASGQGSYELGYWNGFTGFYGRLVTTNSTDQNYGNFLGTDIIPSDQTWYHIAMTYDAAGGADNWRYYVNGELAGSTTLTGNIAMDYMPLVLGPDTSGYNGGLQFANFRLWNRARTPNEIISTMSSALTGSEQGLMAYYAFNDSTRDMTGRGNDGILMYQETYVTPTLPTPVTIVPLAVAVDNDQWTVSTGDLSIWKGQTAVSHDGVDAAQSGKIPNSKSTWMQTDVAGPGLLSFWWKVSSEGNYDFLRFKVDGLEPAAAPGISGEVDWTQITVDIPAGSHTLQWVYSKDGGAARGQDAGWVDQVVFTKQQQLALAFAGNGNGQVNGDMSCISGAACTAKLFPEGSRLVLTASPDTSSTFAGWNGCTSVSGTTCNVTMNAGKTVTVTFDPGLPVRILENPEIGFPSLRKAYDEAALPPAVSTIQIRSIQLPDPPITFDRPVSVVVKGGYDATFDPANSGFSYILGPAKVKDGKVVMERLGVK